MPQFIDISMTVEGKPKGSGGPEITYITHEETVQSMGVNVYGLQPSAFDIRGGKYCAMERVYMTTHDTTHLDAPWHYAPTSEGKPAKKIDEIPLRWCFGDGVLLDFHHKKAEEEITSKDLLASLDTIGYELKPWDIVFIKSK